MGLFGPTKQEISWRRFASEVGGTVYYFPRFYFWDLGEVEITGIYVVQDALGVLFSYLRES